MPAKDSAYWAARARQGNSWYGDRWLDWQAKVLCQWALHRLDVPLGPHDRVLDIGCGDGRFSAWLAEKYGCPVTAVDLYDFKPVRHPRVTYRFGVDAEALPRDLLADVGFMVGVLEGVRHRQAALESAARAVKHLVVVEELRKDPQPYQLDMPHKWALYWDLFKAELALTPWEIAYWVPATMLDRAWAANVPRWLWPLVVPASVAVDLALTSLPLPPALAQRWSRFRAVLLVRREKVEATEYAASFVEECAQQGLAGAQAGAEVLRRLKKGAMA